MKKSVKVVVFLCFCVLALAGCAGISKRDKGTGSPALLEPQGTLKFSDVPVPVGFKFLAQDSYSFESAGVRVGVLKYQGKSNVDRVLNFYKEQMPMYNWNLLNVVEYGERLLNFDRQAETCIITLSCRGNNITMTISLGPKSQISKSSEKQKTIK